jgi:1,2-diacylglycerol 3-alpha-glucosyltransferase
MRILIVGSTYPPHTNGQSIFTANLAHGLAKMGHEVLVFKPSEHGRPYQIQEDGVRVVAIRSLHLTWISSDLYLAFSYRKVVQKIFDTYQPEVIHLQDSAPICRYVARVAHERGLRVMATHHIGPEVGAPMFTGVSKWFRHTLNDLVWIWLLSYLNRMDLVIAPSKAAVAMLKRRGLKSRVYPLSCGVDIKHFHPDGVQREAVRSAYHLDPTKKIFLYVGRLDIEKRVDVLLQAMAVVRNTDVQLVLAGTGAVEEKLKELAAHLGLGERVRFLGHVPHEELNSLINCADVFVMPGDAESLSIATLEAMACAKPVCAVNAMALPELVAEGSKWKFVPTRQPLWCSKSH